MSESICLSIPCDPTKFALMHFDEPVPHDRITAYVRAIDIPADALAKHDKNNPRSHNNPKKLTTKVSKGVRDTLLKDPAMMALASGGSLLVCKSAKYNGKIIQLIMTEYENTVNGPVINRAKHGTADGATTMGNLAIVQRDALPADQVALKRAFIRLDIVSGDFTKEQNFNMCVGRNTTQPVRSESKVGMEGKFDWIRHLLSLYKDKIMVNIAYDENEPGLTIKRVLAITNLFIPHYSIKENGVMPVPTRSYCQVGSMAEWLKTQEKGFCALNAVSKVTDQHVFYDILWLHDQIKQDFFDYFRLPGSKRSVSRLKTEKFSRGKKVNEKLFAPFTEAQILNFSPMFAKCKVDDGVLYPLLASLRPLLKYEDGRAEWRYHPVQVWKKLGKELVETVINAFTKVKNLPAQVGKDSNIYKTLAGIVENWVKEEDNKKLQSQLKEYQEKEMSEKAGDYINEMEAVAK